MVLITLFLRNDAQKKYIDFTKINIIYSTSILCLAVKILLFYRSFNCTYEKIKQFLISLLRYAIYIIETSDTTLALCARNTKFSRQSTY